jgi:hypothetical protein
VYRQKRLIENSGAAIFVFVSPHKVCRQKATKIKLLKFFFNFNNRNGKSFFIYTPAKKQARGTARWSVARVTR